MEAPVLLDDMTRIHFSLSIFLLAVGLNLSLAMETNFGGTQLPIGIKLDTMANQISDISFRRIRVATEEDIDRLYPVLAAYIQNPTLASTVVELVIDVESWPTYSMNKHPTVFFPNIELPEVQESSPPPSPDEVAAHAQIEAYVRTLGLSDDVTKSIIQSLSWKFNGEPTPSNPNHGGPNSTRELASALTTLLLSICRNVTLLHACGLESSIPVRDFLLRNNYGRLPVSYLQRLEKVQIQAWNPEDSRLYDRLEFLEYFRFFGRLPAMRTYSANAVSDYEVEREVAPPGSSDKITKISITNADVSGDLVGSIIRIPGALEEFTLSLGGLSHGQGGGPLVNPKTLGKCLLEQKGTLKVLDLDVASSLGGLRDEAEEEFEHDEIEDEDLKDEYFRLDEQAGNGGPLRSFDLPNTRKYGLTIGSLHDFEALEHLAISARLMLGPVTTNGGREGNVPIPPFRLVDALPKNLKSLHLYDYVVGQCPLADEHVQELKSKMAERFPFLTEVKGLDEPLIKNSKYNADSGWDEENPSELVALRVHNRGLDWEVA